ncbi:isochorismatase [Candidatus Parcubacteria bacterium]|nr:isochorismatase [Candidatus Parcubacteria bacterium]
MNKILPIPPHFNPSQASEAYRNPYQELFVAAQKWARDHGLTSAGADKKRVCLMPIDTQNTFCLPDFELFVAGASGNGAVDDNIRLCEFIYRNLGTITEICPTMDTHKLMQIFHQMFWVNENGEHPEPMTIISLDDVKTGVWKVNPKIAVSVANGNYAGLQRHALHYVTELTNAGKYPLIIWPFHAMLGGIGHALASVIEAACFFHATARGMDTGFEIKGGNPLSENYSVLRPEVLTTDGGNPIGQKNTTFIEKLLSSDVLIIAGQAKSHCLAWTIQDLLDEILAQDPSLAKKVYILLDCTSPVVIPGVIDFTPQADEAFQRFADAGMHIVNSTDPITDWPDIDLG